MKLFKSIKWQLLVWQTVLLAAVLVTLLTLHYQLHKRDLLAGIDAEIQDALIIMMPIAAPVPGQQPGELSAPPGRRLPAHRRLPDTPFPEAPPSPSNMETAAREFLNNLSEQNLFAIVRGQQQTKYYGNVPEPLPDSLPIASKPERLTVNDSRLLIQPHRDIQIIIGRPLDKVNAEMAAALRLLVLIGGTVLAIGFAIGWVIVSRSLRPIKTISNTAKTIASGEHHKRIELSDAPEEMASMALTLNRSFDYLDETIENQKRFSADASHELRTPIAVVIAQAEAALKRERTPEEYQNILQACLRAGRRMKNMAESLLTLTRIDSRSTALSIEPGDLNDVLSGAVDSASLLSEKHPIDFQRSPALSEVEGETPLIAEIDRDRIHQAVMNLLTNAIQHNPDGCALHVLLNKENDQAVIKVTDEGIGIPEEHLPHLFERFYRVDKSRSRAQGGAGLGLSIVQSLVEAHNGTIEVESQPGNGTTFTIRIPLA